MSVWGYHLVSNPAVHTFGLSPFMFSLNSVPSITHAALGPLLRRTYLAECRLRHPAAVLYFGETAAESGEEQSRDQGSRSTFHLAPSKSGREVTVKVAEKSKGQDRGRAGQ